MTRKSRGRGVIWGGIIGFGAAASVRAYVAPYIADYGPLRMPRGGGRMRILCAIHPPEAIRKILDCLGLPSRPPPIVRTILEREIAEHEFF